MRWVNVGERIGDLDNANYVVTRDCINAKTGSNGRAFPVLALDSHDGGLLVREADFAFLVEACLLKVINESASMLV
jgi:hypothetical protein